MAAKRLTQPIVLRVAINFIGFPSSEKKKRKEIIIIIILYITNTSIIRLREKTVAEKLCQRPRGIITYLVLSVIGEYKHLLRQKETAAYQ